MRKRLSDEDLRQIKDRVEAGLIRAVDHPTNGYVIYNYTEKCAYERAWDEYTLQSRGLILDQMGYVVARGMNKFFNYGEQSAPELSLNAICSAHDKMDGSLGIAYEDTYGFMRIATRGSFTSEQAIRGTEILQSKYDDWRPASNEVTYLFEIVYPENRIVLDYGDTEDLVFLGVADNDAGVFYPSQGPYSAPNWPGPRAPVLSIAATIEEVLTWSPRQNAEGVVLRFLDGSMLKIKQDDYVQLHKVVTNLTPKRAWQSLVDGTFDDILAKLPRDFATAFELMADKLYAERDDLEDGVLRDFYLAREVSDDRKSFAEHVKDNPYRGILFQLLDGKDIGMALWQAVKPKTKEL